MYLLDTNILSELMRRQPNPQVEARFASEPGELFASAITVEEIRTHACRSNTLCTLLRGSCRREEPTFTTDLPNFNANNAMRIDPTPDHTAAAVFGLELSISRLTWGMVPGISRRTTSLPTRTTTAT